LDMLTLYRLNSIGHERFILAIIVGLTRKSIVQFISYVHLIKLQVEDLVA